MREFVETQKGHGVDIKAYQNEPRQGDHAEVANVMIEHGWDEGE